MKRLLLILPAALLIAGPSVALAHSGENHGQNKSEIETRHENEERDDDFVATGSVRKSEDEDENEDENDEHSDNRAGTNLKITTKDNPGQDSTRVSIKLRGLHGSSVAATHSATPSASIKINGPLDQVIEILGKVLDFLKNLI